MSDRFTADKAAHRPGAGRHSRRIILTTGVVGVTAAALGVPAMVNLAAADAAADVATLDLTPSCTDGDDTPSNIEGPFFKRNSPMRNNLVTIGVTGVLLTLSGTILTQRCKPVRLALIEFWQADRRGDYDNMGFTLRGHLFTDTHGRYTLKTIVPKDYPGRTPHIHVKVQAPHGPVLTTQLYFPDDLEAYGMNVRKLNAEDAFMERKCTIKLEKPVGNRYTGRFDFVIGV